MVPLPVPDVEAVPPRWPQFSLRALFVLIAACSVLFAVMAAVGPVWSVLVVWFLILVAAHVSANVWGSKVGRLRHSARAADDVDQVEQSVDCSSTPALVPPRQLREKAALGKTMFAISGTTAALGAIVGSQLFWPAEQHAVKYAGLIVGSLSSSIIGGFAGFLCSSFLGVALAAMNEASQDVASAACTSSDSV